MNYAQLCLTEGKFEKIPEIFGDKLELSLVYPERKEFHASEALSFNHVIGEYLLRTGKREAAKSRYEFMKKIEPNHPLTKNLAKILTS